MNFRHTLLSTACAVALVASSGAYAADKAGAGVQQNTNANATVTGQKAGAMSDIRADDLIGKSVTNHKDETVGDVESVILGASGKVQAVVIGVGGFLGLGERSVALDWNSLEISKDSDEIRVTATADQLKAMPAYDYRETSWRGKAYRDDRYRPMAAAGTANNRMANDRMGNDRMANNRMANNAAANRDSRELNESVDSSTLMDGRGNVKASELIGMDVVNSTGDTIGDIDEILISEDGKVHAIISAGGFLGMGETRLQVAWSSLALKKEGDQVQVRTTMAADDLRKLPYEDK